MPALPYRLPQLIEAVSLGRRIYIFEGEAKVELLLSWNVPATCCAGGAEKWLPEHGEYLRDADVVILPDNDDPGRKHRNVVGASLRGVAASVRVLDLPGLRPKGDVIDWAKAGGTVEHLYELTERAAEPWREDEQRPTENSDAPSEAPPGDKETQPLITARPFAWPDPASIPRRQFHYGRHYIRKAVGTTIGAGGRAKTTLGMTEAVSMACGRGLLSSGTMEPLRVWLLNGEEDQEEVDRRATAACRHHSVTKAQCGDRLFIQSVRDKPIRLATLSGNMPTLNRPALDQIEAEMKAKRFDVLMIDPLVSFHSISESSNEHMDLLFKEGLGGIASRTNSAIEVFHHPTKPKPGQGDTTVEDARGASAIIFAARSARVLNFMILGEATDFGISEEHRRLYIRTSNGKANMGPIGKAEWFKLEAKICPTETKSRAPVCGSPRTPSKGSPQPTCASAAI